MAETQNRFWIVDANPETGEVDPEQVAQTAAHVAIVLAMAGGTVSFEGTRVEVLEDVFVTTRVVFQWKPSGPSRRLQRQEEPVPLREPEDEAAEREPEYENVVTG